MVKECKQMTVKRLLISLWACVLALSGLSGCAMLGPDFERPETKVAEQWLESEEAGILSEPAEDHAWWEVFEDPVLSELVENAYRQNLSLTAAGLRVLEARAILGIATGNLYPQMQEVSAGITRIGLSKNLANHAPGMDRFYTDASVGFDAAWELDLWGRFRRGVEAADAEFLGSIADYDAILVSLTAEVARTYTLFRTQAERLRIAEANVRNQKESLRIVSVRYDNGVVTELDVQQARALLHNTQASIPALRISGRRARNALCTLLGLPPTDLDAMLGKGAIPSAPSRVAVGIPANLLMRRPDIRRAELSAAAQCARIGIARSDLYPSFSLIGGVGLNAADTGGTGLDELFEKDALGYSLGPSIRWPILNYGRLKNQVRVQDARFEQAVAGYRSAVLEAAREAEDAMTGFLRSREQERLLKKSVAAARRAAELSMTQYREGAVDFQRVLDSDRFFTEQQDLHTEVLGNIALNLIALYKALGGGWQLRSGNAFVPPEIWEQMKARTDWGKLGVAKSREAPAAPVSGEKWRRPDW